jgi:hypothetical protein
MAKITKQELKEVQELLVNVHALQSQIGQVEIQKAEMIKQCNRATAKLEVLKNELSEKYGEDVSIDGQTGEITKKDAANS